MNSKYHGNAIVMLILLFVHERGVESIACSSPPCFFYSNGTSISSLQITSSKRIVVVKHLVDATALDVHIEENLLFWTEKNARIIRRVNLIDGKIEEVITKDLGEVGGLSVEWQSGLLYWTDVKRNKIEVARLDGKARRVLVDMGVARPRAIAVDPRKGYMFWTVEGTQARIERSHLSGEKRTTIVRLTRSYQHWPNQIVIDFEEDRLYWIDAFTDTIESVGFDGDNREGVNTMRDVIRPLGLTILDSVLYWTDRGGSRLEKILNEINSRRPGNYGIDNGDIRGLALIDSSRQPQGKDICRNQGPCSHLCLLTPNGHRCACPTGIDIEEDGRHCDEGVMNDILLVASFSKRKIYQVTNFEEDNPQRSSMSLKNIRRPLALAFDPKEEMVYWTDVALRRISRAYLDGQDEEVIIGDELLSPQGLAVDTVARNLYWTDHKTGRIEVSKLDGSNRKVLISEELKKPLDIVLDIQRRIMYWSSGGYYPTIERANMDGTDRQIVTKFPKSLASHVPLPQGLALDPVQNKLYCTDKNLGRIQFIDLKSARPTFTTLISHDADYMRRPYGLAIDTAYVYWTDTTLGALYRANKATGGGVERLAAVEAPRDVLAYRDAAVSTDNNPCAQDNGGCTHLCLLRPDGHQCACPTDLPDDDSCFTTPTTDSPPVLTDSPPEISGPVVANSNVPSWPSSAPYTEENFEISRPVVDNSNVPSWPSSAPYTEESVEISRPVVDNSNVPSWPSSAPYTEESVEISRPVVDNSNVQFWPSSAPYTEESVETSRPVVDHSNVPSWPSSAPYTEESVETSRPVVDHSNVPSWPSSAPYTEESVEISRPVVDNSSVPSPSSRSFTNGEIVIATPDVVTNTLCNQTTCLNGGWCSETGSSEEGPCLCPPHYALEHCELFIGAETVKITFEMRDNEWNEELFQTSLSEALTEYCAADTTMCHLDNSRLVKTVSRRSIGDVIFTPDDVVVPQRPDEVGELLEVEAAVLRPLSYSSDVPELVTGRALCIMVKFSAGRIGEYFGRHKLVYINGKHDPSCDEVNNAGEKSHLQKDKALLSTITGGIIGAIVAVVILTLVVIIIATVLIVGVKRGVFRQITTLPRFVRNPEYEYKMLEQESRESSHISEDFPTYEEITPKLLSSSVKKAAKKEKFSTNNPVRSVENVYSEPLKRTPCLPRMEEDSNLEEAHGDGWEVTANADAEDESDGAGSASESASTCEGESNLSAGSDDPDQRDMDTDQSEGLTEPIK